MADPRSGDTLAGVADSGADDSRSRKPFVAPQVAELGKLTAVTLISGSF
jgi:hypothetical protein